MQSTRTNSLHQEINRKFNYFYKEVRKSDVTNKRPVKFLPIVSKLFGKLIARTLTKQVAKVISRDQHRFLPRRCVVIHLLLSLSKIYQNIYAVDVTNRLVLLDFSKAFDKIKHSILLKLLSLNLSKRLYNLYCTT